MGKTVKAKSGGAKGQRRTPSRLAKSRLVERLKEDTKLVNGGNLTTRLRRQGYEEIPLDELQDRLSKLRTGLGDLILSGRG